MGKASRKKRTSSRNISETKNSHIESPITSTKVSLLHKPLIHILLIIILGFLAYSNTFNALFHFDDAPNIVENYKLRDLSNFWHLSGSRWFGFLSFALNYHFGRLNTIDYHIVNLTIHILNAILVYYLVILSLRTPYFLPPLNSPLTKGGCRGVNLIAIFSALLFVAHPIQTQAVTYIVQRFTSLATMFYLLSLVMYIKFRMQKSEVRTQSTPSLTLPPRGERMGGGDESKLQTHRLKSVLCYLASVVCAVLAMKTKDIAFTLPIIITLYEFMFFEGKIKKRILYFIPLILTMLIIPLSLVGIDKPISDAIGELREAAQETEEIPRWGYLFTQFRVIVTYIRLLFLPINQNLDYDYPIYHSFFNPEVFLSFLFLLSIFILAIYLFYRSRVAVQGSQSQNSELKTLRLKPEATSYTLHATRLIAFGVFWFFITLSVESSIIPIRDVIFEHRLYLPTVGIIIAFSTTIFYYASQTTHRISRFSLTAVYLLLTTVIISFSIATYQRNIVWQDEVSLWEDVVRKSPKKARGYNNLGTAYDSNGLIDKAMEHYQIALRLKPDDTEAHNNLGLTYDNKGLIDKAIEHYQIALSLKPDHPKVHYNIGNLYNNKGLTSKAIEHYLIALSLKPDFVEAHNNLGLAYDNKGLIDKAIEHYQIALSLKPDHPKAHNNIGIAYKAKGLIDKAIEHYQIALSLKPDYVEAHNNIGNAYMFKSQIDKAIEHYSIALNLKPNNADIHNNLGMAYMQKGLIDEAIKKFQIALQLNPELTEARKNLEFLINK